MTVPDFPDPAPSSPTPDPQPPDAAHAEPDLLPLDPRVLRAWRLAAAGYAIVVAALALALELLIDVTWATGLLAGVIVVVGMTLALVLPPLRYRSWGYALRDSDLYLRRGVLVRTTSIVPHARIQHVDTRHGPLDRWLGLAMVVVYTAGTRGAIVAIPGLAQPDADALRDRLVALSGAGDAV